MGCSRSKQYKCQPSFAAIVFYGVDSVNLSGKKVTFLGFEYVDDDNLAVIYKKNNKKEKVALNAIEFIKPTKIQKLWLEGYNLWKSHRSHW